ncbi:hypothetical protein J437_LFUL005279 [Ladona fulva]|uniref:Uncharacterized protein n=1 Tax=Ladona fulva TaxID=123851 RepID=A0A8K0K275_LADFU|nr:hypothetical protein J437_LFUL005279 [Ladona fulva]
MPLLSHDNCRVALWDDGHLLLLFGGLSIGSGLGLFDLGPGTLRSVTLHPRSFTSFLVGGPFPSLRILSFLRLLCSAPLALTLFVSFSILRETLPRVAPDTPESESPIPGASLTVDSEESDKSPFPGELILPGVSCEPPRSSLSSREDVGLRQSVLRGHFSAPSKVGVRGPFAEPSKVFKFPVSILVPRVAREIRGPPMQSPACMDIRKTEHVKGRSINLAMSVRSRAALATVGLEDKIIRDHGIPMRGRMIHSTSGDKKFIPYGKSDQVRLSSLFMPKD